MPVNRSRRRPLRRNDLAGEGRPSRAVQELLVTGHWWPFLAAKGEVEPPEEEVRRLYEKYRSELKEKQPDSWAEQYFEGDYKDFCSKEAGYWTKWIRNEQDEAAVNQGCWFDYHEATRPIVFSERFLYHSGGEISGQPFRVMDWIKYQLIMPLYGWKRSDEKRRFQRAYLEIPKKNAKTTTLAQLSLYALIGDRENEAQAYSAANSREQASILFQQAMLMVKKSPELSRVIRILESQKYMTYSMTDSFYRALSRDAAVNEGPISSFVAVDEYHAHKSSDLYDTLRYSGASRAQPLNVVITTAGEDCQGPCWDLHNYAQKVLENSIEDINFLPIIYGIAREEMDEDPECWKREETWRRVNPSLGDALPIENMRTDFKEALMFPSKRMQFKRYRLNFWGEKETRWLPMHDWNQCKGDQEFVQEFFGGLPVRRREEFIEALKPYPCYAGLDLSSKYDMTSLVLIFPIEELDIEIWLSWHWVPEQTAVDRKENNKQRYDLWEEEGWVIFIDGEVIDHRPIRKKIEELGDYYEILQIGLDPHNGRQIEGELVEKNFDVVEIAQGYRDTNEAMGKIEKRVVNQTLVHLGDPVLKWMASNVVVKENWLQYMMPDKSNSSEKIDGVVAGIIAECLVIRNEAEGPSVYESRGLETVVADEEAKKDQKPSTGGRGLVMIGDV